MTWAETDGEERGAETSRRFPFDASLVAALQREVDAALAAGDRLAASADPDAVPLPVVRLPATTAADERA